MLSWRKPGRGESNDYSRSYRRQVLLHRRKDWGAAEPDTVRRCYNSRLRVLGIVLNKFNQRFTLNREVLDMAEQIAQQLDTRVFHSRIRSGVAVAEAPAYGESVLSYAPDSKVARDFRLLINEIARMYEPNLPNS